MDENRPGETAVEEQQASEQPNRMGKFGETSEQFDNGFYTTGQIFQLNTECLIDNGSTSTILSHKQYELLDPNIKPPLSSVRIQ